MLPTLTRRDGKEPGPKHTKAGRTTAESWRAPVSGLVPVVHGVSGGLAGRGRRQQIRALGNAVVPQCAQIVGEVIQRLLRQSHFSQCVASDRACASSSGVSPNAAAR